MTAKGISLWLAASMLLGQSAQALDVTVAYQTSAEPAKVAQADNSFARESGATVDWRKFDSGASVVRALALAKLLSAWATLAGSAEVW